jgi:type IV secretion system protein VirD4
MQAQQQQPGQPPGQRPPPSPQQRSKAFLWAIGGLVLGVPLLICMLSSLQPNVPGSDPVGQTIGAVFAMGFMGCLALACYFLLPRLIAYLRRLYSPSTAHGSARFAVASELADYAVPPRPPAHRLLLGWHQGEVMSLSERHQEQHVMIVGPTGRGKSTGIIIPGLLCEQGSRSLFVLDLKGELVRIAAGAIALNHEVWLFSPTQPGRSVVYNPLQFITSQEDAQTFARIWIANTGESRDPFWDRSAELVIVAALLHLRDTEPGAPLSRLADLLATSFKHLQAILVNSRSLRARNLAGPLFEDLAMNDRLAVSILTGLKSRFFLLQDAPIRAVTGSPAAGGQQIDFPTLLHDPKPKALFFSAPASEAIRLKPLVSLMVTQMMTAAIREAEQHGGQLPRPLACYLDDLPAAGHLTNFEQHLAMLRSRRVALLFAIQNFSQLDDIYGRNRRPTILANANTHIVLPGTGQEEAEFYSRRLGNATVFSRGDSVHLAEHWTSSFHWRETARPLLTADEIRRLPEYQMLVVAEARPAFVVHNVRYWQQPGLQPRISLPY